MVIATLVWMKPCAHPVHPTQGQGPLDLRTKESEATWTLRIILRQLREIQVQEQQVQMFIFKAREITISIFQTRIVSGKSRIFVFVDQGMLTTSEDCIGIGMLGSPCVVV